MNEQVAVLLLPSVAVQVTVVIPTGTEDPEGGEHTAVTPGQLSDAVGAAYVTTTVGLPAAPTAVTLPGHVIVGGWVSLIVTVNEQVGPADDVQVTVVVPTGKNDPDAGLQVIVPQVPLVVGAG